MGSKQEEAGGMGGRGGRGREELVTSPGYVWEEGGVEGVAGARVGAGVRARVRAGVGWRVREGAETKGEVGVGVGSRV